MPLQAKRAHQSPSLRVGRRLRVVVGVGIETTGGGSKWTAHRLVLLPVLLLTLPRVIKGLAASRTPLERLEEALALHTAWVRS